MGCPTPNRHPLCLVVWSVLQSTSKFPSYFPSLAPLKMAPTINFGRMVLCPRYAPGLLCMIAWISFEELLVTTYIHTQSIVVDSHSWHCMDSFSLLIIYFSRWKSTDSWYCMYQTSYFWRLWKDGICGVSDDFLIYSYNSTRSCPVSWFINTFYIS